MQNVLIYSKPAGLSGMRFYADINGEQIWLFDTEYYSENTHRIYRAGLPLEKVLRQNTRTTGKDPFTGYRNQKLKERIVRMLRYTEREYGIRIFKKERHTPRAKALAGEKLPLAICA